MRSLLTLFLALACTAFAADWQPVAVPGAWPRGHSGVAWYRAWVKPAPLFFNAHERNLFEESVTVILSEVADAHEVFVNGVAVGAGGKFPPNFASDRADLHTHKVPVGT